MADFSNLKKTGATLSVFILVIVVWFIMSIMGSEISESIKASLFLLMMFIFGLFLFYRGFFTLRRKRKIENTPTSKIRGISLGEVEIYGEALTSPKDAGRIIMSADSNISPLTKKECVYFDMTIEEERSSGKNRTWVVVDSRSYVAPFYVKDETGKVLVNPNGAEINVPIDFQEVSGMGRDPSKEVKEYLEKNKIKFEGFLGMNKTMRFTEQRIEIHNKVYVFGYAMPSGKMSSIGNENIVINRKDKHGFFFISDRPEKDVLKFFGKRMFFEIYGGAVISTVALAIFLAIAI